MFFNTITRVIKVNIKYYWFHQYFTKYQAVDKAVIGINKSTKMFQDEKISLKVSERVRPKFHTPKKKKLVEVRPKPSSSTYRVYIYGIYL